MRKAPTFDPSINHTSPFSQLHKLDSLPAEGIPEVEFWKLFSKCRACGNYMTTRTIPYHICPTPGQLYLSRWVCFSIKQLAYIAYVLVPHSERNPGSAALHSAVTTKDQYCLLHLDAHGVGRAAGICESVFKNIFYTCGQCNHYMTERISPNHHEDTDLGDNTCINRAAPWPESRFGRPIRRAIARTRNYEKFPVLDPFW